MTRPGHKWWGWERDPKTHVKRQGEDPRPMTDACFRIHNQNNASEMKLLGVTERGWIEDLWPLWQLMDLNLCPPKAPGGRLLGRSGFIRSISHQKETPEGACSVDPGL